MRWVPQDQLVILQLLSSATVEEADPWPRVVSSEWPGYGLALAYGIRLQSGVTTYFATSSGDDYQRHPSEENVKTTETLVAGRSILFFRMKN